MIVTLTPNPSVDRTLRIAELRRGAFIRATGWSAEAGGKGINVARSLATEGHDAIAVAPASPSSSAQLVALLDGAVRFEPVAIGGELRTNVSIVEPDGTTTKVNEGGPTVSADESERVVERVVAIVRATGAGWVAGCGSLAPGMPAELYARLRAALPAEVRLAVDADGEPLRSVLGRVDLVKPNHEELERLVGRSLGTLGEVAEAAEALVAGGVGRVLVSLGDAGALLVGPGGAVHAEPRDVRVLNTVGAGDALLAGFLAAGADEAGIGEAVAWSIAACESSGTRMRQVTDDDRVRVHRHGAVDGERRVG